VLGVTTPLLFLIGSAFASPDSPTPTPDATREVEEKQAAKPTSKGIARSARLAPAGEPIYLSRQAAAAPAKRKTKAELEAYRRRLERDWEKEVLRREKEKDKITPEQIYLWRRMGRPWGAPFRNFIEDRARYGDPSLGQ
jgi:hypothetical protein